MTGLSFIFTNNSFDVILRLSITFPIIYPRRTQTGSRNVNLYSASGAWEATGCQDERKHISLCGSSGRLWFHDLEGSDAQNKTILHKCNSSSKRFSPSMIHWNGSLRCGIYRQHLSLIESLKLGMSWADLKDRDQGRSRIFSTDRYRLSSVQLFFISCQADVVQ